MNITLPAHPDTNFDEKHFLELLAGSLSLTIEEKKEFIRQIKNLSQLQINDLIKIFEEEKVKFADMYEKYSSDIDKMKRLRNEEWENYDKNFNIENAVNAI